MNSFEVNEKIKTKDENISVSFLTAVTDFSNYKKIHLDIIDEIEKRMIHALLINHLTPNN